MRRKGFFPTWDKRARKEWPFQVPPRWDGKGEVRFWNKWDTKSVTVARRKSTDERNRILKPEELEPWTTPASTVEPYVVLTGGGVVLVELEKFKEGPYLDIHMVFRSPWGWEYYGTMEHKPQKEMGAKFIARCAVDFLVICRRAMWQASKSFKDLKNREEVTDDELDGGHSDRDVLETL